METIEKSSNSSQFTPDDHKKFQRCTKPNPNRAEAIIALLSEYMNYYDESQKIPFTEDETKN